MKSGMSLFLLCAITAGLWAQGARETPPVADENQMPLKRVVILTSGLAYYEHSGAVNGQFNIDLSFRLDAVNDALKTLVINDPSSGNISVNYQSENTLFHTLRSLIIDLSDEPGMAVILSRLRGAEAEIYSPTPFTGRIAGIEYRPSFSNNSMTNEPWLLLNTNVGMRTFNLKDISTIKFTDNAVEDDLNRALDLISASRNSSSRRLSVNLPGSGRRNVSISYVIPSPVWKISYRLNLGAAKPLFQGWAIVDNDSDTDWNNVELSLVAGRPVSFIQNLYPPYYVSRPVLPLSIAGTAEAAVYGRAYAESAAAPMADTSMMMKTSAVEQESLARQRLQSEIFTGGNVQTAAGGEAGGQFEFTIKNPVNLDRRMSAMFPLVESQIDAKKLLIYSGSGRYPRLGAEITNTSKMKLPAGPITVFDGGVYAGDALIEFWNENEKRLISFGEDLSVTAAANSANARAVTSVNVSGGVMTINRSLSYIKTYTFINSSSVPKQLVVEHSKTPQTALASPQTNEQTENVYRFNVTLPANRETVLTVNEVRPISESITLLSLRPDAFLSYTSNQEIPNQIRQAFARAVELKQVSDTAALSVKEIEAQKNRLIADQDRIRRNLEAAGNQTQQGQEYLRRLVSLDSEIDAINITLEKANTDAKTAQQAYENYLAGLRF